MELDRVDARPLILLNDEDFDCLYKGIKNFQIVSDFFKQERLKVVDGRVKSDSLFRYRVTPLAVAVVAIAYPFYQSSPKSIPALIADFAIVIFGPFGLQGMIDLWKGGSFVGEELRLSRGNTTIENGSFINDQTPELNFKEYFKNKNLPEEDLELLLDYIKVILPTDRTKMFFSSIESALKEDESDLKYLFKIPFAKDTDLGSQLPNDVWELIAKDAASISNKIIPLGT